MMEEKNSKRETEKTNNEMLPKRIQAPCVQLSRRVHIAREYPGGEAVLTESSAYDDFATFVADNCDRISDTRGDVDDDTCIDLFTILQEADWNSMKYICDEILWHAREAYAAHSLPEPEENVPRAQAKKGRSKN
ncbi:MAG: hypothetical protein M0R80_17195 [Proteobacteria bacterium]|jgi:hypothetical protein|nr:hypothetical protein [Pseudomonadota bacterium]